MKTANLTKYCQVCKNTTRGKTVVNNNIIVPGFDDETEKNIKIRLHEVPDVNGCLVLVLAGYINTYNSHHFLKQIQKAIDAGFVRLIFDCSGLGSVSSAGIGSFTALLKMVKPQGGDVVLLGVQPEIHELLQLLGLSRFFNSTNSLDESIDFFMTAGEDHAVPDFPIVFQCFVCSKKLKAVKPGRFRCSECKTILTVDNAGEVTLG
jgi:anti-anti-sigma factor